MKAFLLAAGYGTRLRPLTNNTPKCLIPINGKPLLQYWINLFKKYNIDEVCINLHYLPEQVEAFINQDSSGIKWTLTFEEKLLGSGGTIYNNKDFIKNDKFFFVCNADNFTNINFNKMLNFHLQKKTECTLALFKTDNPTECGIVEIDANNYIVDFEEKPKNPKSNLANGGIYIFNSSIYNKNISIPCDLGYNVLPNLNKYGYIHDGFLYDIGTLETYNKIKENNYEQ